MMSQYVQLGTGVARPVWGNALASLNENQARTITTVLPNGTNQSITFPNAAAQEQWLASQGIDHKDISAITAHT